MKTSPFRVAATLVALFFVAPFFVATTTAATSAKAQSARQEVVRVQRIVPIAAPMLSSTEAADYVRLITASLDACARSTPNRAIPFAGRARLVVTVTERFAAVEIIDVEPAIADLRERCLENAPALPPLPSIGFVARFPTGYARFYLDVAIDSRGFPASIPRARSTPTRVVLDSSSLTLQRSDSSIPALAYRDALFVGLEPYLEPLLVCFRDESERGAYDGTPIRLELSIARGGRIESARSAGRFGLPSCISRVLRGVRFGAWPTNERVELSLDIAAP